MRFQAITAVGLAVLLGGCAGSIGWFGGKAGPGGDADLPPEITKPIGPHLVARCPVPIAYDDATTRKIQEALDKLPKDSVLRKVMTDYEAERDNLRMCQ
ncbi:MAG: hypothetical protein JO258_13695 [Alphaproteobacteria bacterium]|nr:hypothetical protein [Alphaproteobacteria bacterium]